MIRSLHISNYALISRIDIDFTDGLNIITGETGAGKSIMLGALNMLFGARADAKVITDTLKNLLSRLSSHSKILRRSTIFLLKTILMPTATV